MNYVELASAGWDIRFSEWIMFGTAVVVPGLIWIMKAQSQKVVNTAVTTLQEQRSKDKTRIFDAIRKLEDEQEHHGVKIEILLERSSTQAKATERIDGHIVELGKKLDDLKDLLVKQAQH